MADILPQFATSFSTYFHCIRKETENDDIIYSVACKRCTTILSLRKKHSSTSNLIRHLNSVHQIQYERAVERKVKLGKSINDKIVEFFVETGLPFNIVTYNSFQKLINDKDAISTAESLKKGISIYYNRQKEKLVNNFKDNINYIAITADAWKHFKKTFIGITANWLDPDTFERKVTLLAIKRVTVSLTFDVIGSILKNILEEYQIMMKVVSVTTDNGSNFVKAFSIYGGGKQEETVEDDPTDFEVIDIFDDLNLQYSSDEFPLPPHYRCAAHTLNLVMKDIDSPKNELTNNEKIFTNNLDIVMKKCNTLWSKQNTQGHIIQQICGKTILTS